MTGDPLGVKKSLMRMRIDRSIVWPDGSVAGTQRTSLDSLPGVWLSGHGRVMPVLAAYAERAIELFRMS
jgi:hypothetical protein